MRTALHHHVERSLAGVLGIAVVGCVVSLGTVWCEAADQPAKKIPVILSTDIGDDIDDTWALALALQCPEIDLKIVVGDYGNPVPRATLIAKFLETVGRTEIPVGVGCESPCKAKFNQAKWIEGYDLAKYPGKVHQDGVQAMIDIIMGSAEPITLVCIGPVPNIAEALRREPRIVEKAKFVGMHGSIYRGYGGNPKPSAEWNVVCDPAACRAALTAKWPVLITPLDTCGVVVLRGEKYAKVRDNDSPITKALMENYRVWSDAHNARGAKIDPRQASSTLFDTVAVYLAIAEDLCEIESLPVRVDDKGMTLKDPAGATIRAAVRWKDLGAFEDWLVDRLTKKAK